MAGLRFTDLQSRPIEFLDFTSVTLDEFQQLVPPFEAAFHARMAVAGRVPAGCGYCFGTSPNPSERGQSAGHHHAKPVFKTPSMSLGLHLSTLSPFTPRSSTGILF